MVAAYFGKSVSELTLGRLAGTTKKHGTPPGGLVRAAESIGFETRLLEEASLADLQRQLKRKVPVIVNWFSTDEGHYSVAVGLDEKDIFLQDPDIGRRRKMSREKFVRVWFDYSGECPKKGLFRSRLMLVITPKGWKG
jgi:ABC-type bacteriocin/lantibiotic exporter with double-glycine peptidase domain